jgi:hypothetical protein
MKRVVVLALCSAFWAAPVSASAQTIGSSTGNDIVKRAVAAAGGEQALRALKAVKITGETKWWEPDQSLVTAGPAAFAGETKFTIVWDLVHGSARTSLDRMLPARGHMQFDEVLTPKYGFVVDEKSARPMSGIRVAAQLRELNRVAPNLLLKMLDNPNAQTFEGGVRTADGVQPGISFKDGDTTFIVIFNRKTQLPAIVRTQDDDTVRGTANFEVRLDDWKPVAGGFNDALISSGTANCAASIAGLASTRL